MNDPFLTFADFAMVPGDSSPSIAAQNLKNLNTGIRLNPGSIIYGLSGTYHLAQDLSASPPSTRINVVSGSSVVCFPSCVIAWAFDTKVGNDDKGLLVAAADVQNARWRGGTFQNIPQVHPAPPPDPPYKLYNLGSVIRVLGSDILIEDVTIDGYNGIAMMIAGDRVRVLNPTIRNPQGYVRAGIFPVGEIVPNGAGIRVKRGTGFRCYGGDIATGGDAAIQFSGDSEFVAPDVDTDITDGLFQAVHCSSKEGRLILVGSTYPRIDNVRFVGITGEVSGGGGCIRIQNNVATQTDKNDIVTEKPRKPNPISRVVLRDIAVSGGSSEAIGFAIENKLKGSNSLEPITEDNIAISDVTVENLRIVRPTDVALKVTAAAPASYRSVRNVTWRGGGVFDPQATGDVPMLDIKALAGGLFAGLRIESGNAAVAIGVGDPDLVSAGDVPCSDIVFADVAITGVGAGNTGVRFDAAANCGFVRGRVAEAAGAQAVGVRMSTNSRRCFVEGTDLSALTGANTVQLSPGTSPRVRDLHGSGLTVVPPLGTGPAEDKAMGAHAIDGRAGFLRAQTGTGTTEPVALTAIDGGRLGDLLVVARNAAVGSRPVKVRDVTGLALAGDCTLDTGDDLLTLVNVGTGSWVELARSDTSAP